MKKIILSTALLFAIGFTAKAQEIKYGVKAGVNFATLTGDIPDDVKTRTGFHAGAVAEFKLTEEFSIQPELLYSQQGMKYDGIDADTGIKVKTTWKMDYLILPVVAKYYIIEGFSIEAGPQIGYRLGAKIKAEASGFGENEYDFKDDTKALDFGIIGGLAYDLPMGLFFQARYNAGITKINEGDDSVQNDVFQLSVGYKF
ncbi:porin family protein [Flavobacterium sp. NRK1]|uniref:porin family protein n=1 Tax=Flavobacterium sp. NRK1 TaxID=2954929 RepID=UPI002092E2F7|nr:porin family protein [Flavobacterium sp. NRK1]MCO6146815.1 PorT family protein [Flavobacterium sp. NRK1]